MCIRDSAPPEWLSGPAGSGLLPPGPPGLRVRSRWRALPGPTGKVEAGRGFRGKNCRAHAWVRVAGLAGVLAARSFLAVVDCDAARSLGGWGAGCVCGGSKDGPLAEQ
eukprot:8393906-Alexandrium_andersonii.AAC.1